VAGRSDSEIFFESLARNDVPSQRAAEGGPDMLARYIAELQVSFAARRDLLTRNGRLLPGAAEAAAATAALPGALQSVVTGSIRPNAAAKLAAFGLAGFFDLDIGGYGADPYPRGSQLLRSVTAAQEKYRAPVAATVYIADSHRDVAAARIAGIRRRRQRPVDRHRTAGRGRGRRPGRPDGHGPGGRGRRPADRGSGRPLISSVRPAPPRS
jgi:phosphoglycolate phosphatase